MSASESAFRWDDNDQRLLSAESNDLAEEMSERSKKAESKLQFETQKSGNSAGYLPRLFEFHEQITDEWAERLYAVHCKVWCLLNRPLSAVVIRAIRDEPIAQMFAARKSSLVASICRRASRIGEQPDSTSLAEWGRRMDRLATRWNRKLEAEAIALEVRASTNISPKDPECDSAQKMSEAVIRKVQNPQSFTIVSIPETAVYFEVKPRTVHRWLADGKLRSGVRRGSITVNSIIDLEKKRSRKRRDI